MERSYEVGEHLGDRLDVEHPQLLDHGLERNGGRLVLAARERQAAFDLWDEDLVLRLGILVQDGNRLTEDRLRLVETATEEDGRGERGQSHPTQRLIAHCLRELQSLALKRLALLEVAGTEADIANAPREPPHV